AGAGGLYLYSRQIVDQIDRIPGAFDIPDVERPKSGSTDDLNILLAGSDVRAPGGTTGENAQSEWAPNAGRSDTIMILHIDGDRESAYVASIPRDSWVTIPGHGKN